MSEFSGFVILNIVLIIIGMGLLIKDLYTLSHHGKSIMKVDEKSLLSIFWVGSLIFWCFLLWSNIRFYSSHQKDSVIITNIFTNIFWIELSISNLIKSYMSSEIRENGIYKSGYFYKWSKIHSYTWISSDTIQFKVNTILKGDIDIELIINEEFKLKVDEVIERKILS